MQYQYYTRSYFFCEVTNDKQVMTLSHITLWHLDPVELKTVRIYTE